VALVLGMAHRTFTDPEGTAWEVWDVRPSRVLWAGHDRRSDEDRRVVTAAGLAHADDERRIPERRRPVATGLGCA
jgi:hypothetical protein